MSSTHLYNCILWGYRAEMVVFSWIFYPVSIHRTWATTPRRFRPPSHLWITIRYAELHHWDPDNITLFVWVGSFTHSTLSHFLFQFFEFCIILHGVDNRRWLKLTCTYQASVFSVYTGSSCSLSIIIIQGIEKQPGTPFLFWLTSCSSAGWVIYTIWGVRTRR